MKDNKLNVRINVPVHQLFTFTITPPNSILWVPSITKEESSEWPIRIGTVYTLIGQAGNIFKVTVSALQENKLVEWTAEDNNYHCKYVYKTIDDHTSELEYYEWVDSGELDGPFTQETLNGLKTVLEKSR